MPGRRFPRWRGYGLNSVTTGQGEEDLEDLVEDLAEASEEEAADLEEVTEREDMEELSTEVGDMVGVAEAVDMEEASPVALAAAEADTAAIATEATSTEVIMRAGMRKEGILAEA